MKQDNLYTGNEGMEKIVRGCFKVADAVAGTLGAAGYNCLLEHTFYPYVLTTNDGVTIAKSIVLADPVENMGANIMKEIATRSDKVSGDGTTTSIVLARAIIEEGLKVKASPMEIKKSLEECLPIIEESIKKQTKEITVDEVKAVATISAEDEKIGTLIQEIYQKIGKDGILYIDTSKTFEDFYTIGTGIEIHGAGLASQYMADTVEQNGQIMLTGGVSLKKPKILITQQKITSAKLELNSFLEKLFLDEVKELVIFCDDFEPLILQELLSTRDKGFRTILIKMPVLWKDNWFEDIAKMTGATVIDPVAGLTFKTMKPEHLGTCDSLVADKSNTFLDGILDVSEHIKKIEKEDTDDAKIRAARLNTKTARLFIGAKTEQELNYKNLKITDARNSVYQALHGGIVAGGGVALLNASKVMPDTVGGKILKEALKSPIKQIKLNAGNTEDYRDFKGIDTEIGFDAKSGKFVKMFEAGIVDAANVTLTAVRNSISVASVILTAKCAITLPPKEPISQPDVPTI
jgi:chaperonin GroEL